MRVRRKVAIARTIHRSLRRWWLVFSSRPSSLLYSFVREPGALESGECSGAEDGQYLFGIIMKAIRIISAQVKFTGLSTATTSHLIDCPTKEPRQSEHCRTDTLGQEGKEAWSDDRPIAAVSQPNMTTLPEDLDGEFDSSLAIRSRYERRD